MNVRTETRITSAQSVEIQDLYTKRWALQDLETTIPYYPEKAQLIDGVRTELEENKEEVEAWWAKISAATGKTFSENAFIRFDLLTIFD